jgi:carbonic anhydrase
MVLEVLNTRTGLLRWAACAVLLSWGPVRAGDLCAQGTRQSPIDIRAAEARALPTLRPDYRKAPLRLVNDGHTVRVRLGNGSRLFIGGQAHALQQLHFHLPGGDKIQGEEFPMAVHLLHKSASGGLVAVVVLFRLGSPNAALAALLPAMPAHTGPEQGVRGAEVDPARWLPASLGYYAYDGSLTAPPCTEGVRWIVMKQAQTLSAAQLQRLRELFPNNARSTQALNGRVVLETP